MRGYLLGLGGGLALLAAFVLGRRAAEAEFPVKYEICDATEGDCSVYGRFPTFEDCESLRRYQTMHCVRSPGEILCKEPERRSTIASSRCTR